MTRQAVTGKNPRKVAAGRKGGLATLNKYGVDWLRQQGCKGGQPRHPIRRPHKTYFVIRQQQLLEQPNKNEEVTGTPGRLAGLKRAKKLRDRSSPPEIPEAGTSQETPREQVPAGKEAT